MKKQSKLPSIYKTLFNKDNTVYSEMDKVSTNGSDSSLSIDRKGKDALNTIATTFEIDNIDLFTKGYEMAVSGSGNEGDGEFPRILTIHSSALLPLLCFFNVNEDNPIKIDGTTYTKVFFEVQNKVIKDPSNIDIALVSYKNEKPFKILFLESKFTEYFKLKHEYSLRKSYEKFYIALNPILNNYGLNANYNGKKYCLNTDDPGKKLYLEGIKQMFSHLIGIAKGPQGNQYNKKYQDIFAQAEEFELASIIYKVDCDKFKSYKEIYEKIFGDSTRIKSALKEVLNSEDNRQNIKKLTIRQNLLTYQEVFKKNNPEFKMPDKVRKFYDL